ncbi:hypothetical protein [Flavobacterium sp.]|uniref:hypothetical protein n=1 Tax=Flavobacterium sp. TaxID=239 RepID=UPI0038FC3BCF
MNKLFLFALAFLLFSCNDKKIFLPLADTTIVSDVKDHSPVYIFFKTDKKDTIAEVNRKNTISTTNWIFNIDKRLPLKLIIPEIIKLQEKKNSSAHKNEESENYFSYSNNIKKSLAFLPFTNTHYYFDKKPKSGVIIFFNKKNELFINKVFVKKSELEKQLSTLIGTNYILCFDRNCSYESYIQNKILIEKLKKSNISNEEFIF